MEPGEFGVTVNAVNPAATETRMVTRALDRFREQGGADAEMAKGLAAAMQPAENIAHLITALCHPETDRFNGEIFYVECAEAIPNLIELLIAARTEHAATIADLVATVRHDGRHVT